MHVGDSLASRQRGTDEKWTCIVSEVFRLIGPPADEETQVETSGHTVFVEIQGWKTVWGVPAAA
jgi:hypothetical protein